ncbi:hypothetical protein [Nonomuraea sp. SBT364]|uniref:hypothetical protein n=1 Tax=Nonomuraea sp. SBT364 TaxID=1580530 RepID=UPI001E2F6560|nr:hypothetical protein [Nonomuraea sp. SBT364]
MGRHLVAAERALEADDPDKAHEHTKVARRFAARIGVVREAAGIVAYRAGHFSEALSDLRAARRMTGSDAYLPVMADCERGMGRPERALDLVRSPEAERLDRAERIELSIVESGARRDLGQHDAAVITLQRLPELRDPQPRPWSARLAFAYADALAEAGHQEAATDWFGRAMAFDEDGETDAAERYAELTGAVIEDVEEEFDYEDDFDDAGAASPVSVEDDEPDDAEALAEAGDLLASPPQDTVDAELEDLQEASADADDAPAETRDAGSVVADGESDGDAEESADADGATSEADSADTGTQPEPQDAEPQVAEPSEPQVAERDAEPQDTASEDTASEDTASEDTEGTAGSEPVKSGDSATVTGISPAFIEPDFGDDLDGRDEGAKRDE